MKFGELQRLLTRGARTSTLRPSSAANGHAGSHASQEESKYVVSHWCPNVMLIMLNEPPLKPFKELAMRMVITTRSQSRDLVSPFISKEMVMRRVLFTCFRVG
jgi:hypothetical protein